jgi:hypothetical protein
MTGTDEKFSTMKGGREAIFFVNFVPLVNLVRNLPLHQRKLVPDAGSHKAHKGHKVHKFSGENKSLAA